MSRMSGRRKDLRPREKLQARGATALSDYELLMAIIGSGNAQADVTKIARDVRKLIAEKGSELTYEDLIGIKIPTPVGDYNPDWAIVFENGATKQIYFVAETKGSMSTLQLKGAEILKIDYARKHFRLLESEKVKYDVVDNYDRLLSIIRK